MSTYNQKCNQLEDASERRARIELARSFKLWQECVDPSAHMTEEQFGEMTLAERLNFMSGCFGIKE